MTLSAVAQSPDLGSPPSGRVPILFNDRHIYAKPDELRSGRVLAAIVAGTTVLVPLRSMFEAMGARVRFDSVSRSVTVDKAGASVVVVVDQPEVTINGETRPLDVPAREIDGRVYVPIRVLSEGMGAYVQWVPQRKAVVIRYGGGIPRSVSSAPIELQTSPPQAPAATTPAAPIRRVPVPPGPPIPGEGGPTSSGFVVGDYLIDSRTYNEVSPTGDGGSGSYQARAALDVPLLGIPFMLEGEYRQTAYSHPAGSVTIIGGAGSTFVPAFTGRDYEVEGHAGFQIAAPQVFLAAGYLQLSDNFGSPRLSGFGAGIEKLPDFAAHSTLYGSVYYYPSVSGTCGTGVCPAGPFTESYRVVNYRLGYAVPLGTSPVFIDFGVRGDRRSGKSNTPGDATHGSAFAGIGIHF